MSTNISVPNCPEDRISRLFFLIGQPARIQILMAISAQEACVCHLEAALGMRQASISQHLMVLRKAGLVTTHRSGRNIFYRLVRPEILQVIHQVASLLDIDLQEVQKMDARTAVNCPCPHCNPGLDADLTCRSVRTSISS